MIQLMRFPGCIFFSHSSKCLFIIQFVVEHVLYINFSNKKLSSKANKVYFYLRPHSHKLCYRVVFNSSASSEKDVSITDLQIVGHKIQKDLIYILIRFRKHQIVTAAIEKIYRMLLLPNRDVCNAFFKEIYQRII